MHKDKFKAELGFFESLKIAINKTLQEFVNYKIDYRKEKRFVNIAKRLHEKYNQAYSRVNELLEFGIYKGLQYVSGPKSGEDPEEWYSVLYETLPECDKAIEGLKAKISSPTSNLPIRLKRLKKGIFNFVRAVLNIGRKKWFTMNQPIVWLIFSLVLVTISYFIYKALK